MIGEVLNDRRLLRRIAERSYAHVNRFDKIVLVDAGERGYRLTLHLWWPQNENLDSYQNEPPHNHRFDFWSIILTGRLRSTFFRASSDSVFERFEYWPDETTFASEMRFAGGSGLEVDTWTEAVAGDGYFLPCDLIHSVNVPRNVLTSTLVLRGPRQRGSADVYLLKAAQHDYRVEQPAMTSKDLARKLDSFRSVLAKERET